MKEYLMIPGPTQVPPEVISAMARPMINHRGPEFADIFKECTEGCQWAYQTKKDLFILTASGTGGMEAAIANTLSPGDKVIVGNIGAFGARFVKICKVYGITVEEIKVERGKALEPSAVKEKLDADKNIKAVFFQQNETSTGVLNDVKAISQAIAGRALVIVDAISGLLTADLKTDEWGLDVVIAGSQKAFMIPPGLSFISFSEKAWKAYESAKCPKFYFDLALARKFLEKWTTPATPPISVVYGLQKALQMLKEEGLDNIFKRHDKMAKGVRAAIRALGAKPLSEDKVGSRSVTGVVFPEGVDAEAIRKTVKKGYGVTMAGGQEDLKGKIFRIGHMGYVGYGDLVTTFFALENVLNDLGHKVVPGSSVAAFEQAYKG
ncbi:MAG: alanine--glyoxylate aminotransferase family protein [bacterium]